MPLALKKFGDKASSLSTDPAGSEQFDKFGAQRNTNYEVCSIETKLTKISATPLVPDKSHIGLWV